MVILTQRRWLQCARIDKISPPENIKIETEYGYSTPFGTTNLSTILGYNDYSDINYEYSLPIASLQEKGYVHGIYYLVFAYKLFDGSIIKNSKAYMISTEEDGYEFMQSVNRVPTTMEDGQNWNTVLSTIDRLSYNKHRVGSKRYRK